MNRTSEWIVKPTDSLSPSAYQTGPVMAWARDIVTGEPVYVLELDKSHTGSKCGCECPSCELPLTAVNAAKAEYIKRPHFRHPNGAEKSECMYLSARLAALQLLRDQGVLLLPRRRISGTALGLSGVEHEAWVEHPPERVRIIDFNFQDRVAALLTLEGGRQIRVQLIGTGSNQTVIGSDGFPIPTIKLEVNDLTVASMSLEELKSRLTLVPDNLCWVSHWKDALLQSQADEDARQVADDFMDLDPIDSKILDGIEPKFRRETILHFEVKKILSESKRIHVPALRAIVNRTASNNENLDCFWERPSEFIPLIDVQLEQRFGRVIPDVIATVDEQHGKLMMIEVTVTNSIDDKRLSRIQEANLATLEINLSLAGGLISRADLTEWVVNGLETKSWLHHPEIDLQTLILEREVQVKIDQIEQAKRDDQELRKVALATPVENIAKNYLDAIFNYAEFERIDVLDDSLREKMKQAKKLVEIEAKKFAVHGYKEALDTKLFCGRKGIIPRILSIKFGHGVGYLLDSTIEVMNAIRQSTAFNRSNHTIYLIAEKVYRNSNSPANPEWHKDWVDEIKESIRCGENMYIRNGKFDRLLSLLFPEIKSGLKNGFGTELARNNKAQTVHVKTQGDPQAMQAVRSFYHDGDYRHDAPRILFDDVLKDAEAIRNGESFFKWFEIWSNRYKLRYGLNPIARFLHAAGFVGVMDQWHAWNAYIQKMQRDGRANLIHEDVKPMTLPPVKHPTNLYERRKG